MKVLLCFCAFVSSAFSCTPGTPAVGPDTTPVPLQSSTAVVESSTASDTTTQSQATTTTISGNSACQAVACDFKNSMCQYKPSGGPCTWFLTSGRSGNRDTGIPGPDIARGSTQYIDARPPPGGGKASIISGDLNNAQDLSARIDNLESTNFMNIKMCQNDAFTSCQDVSRFGVDASDREWRLTTVRIPANTKNVVIVCDNPGPNIGDCGISKITIVDANGNDVCGAGSSSAVLEKRKAAIQRQRKLTKWRLQQVQFDQSHRKENRLRHDQKPLKRRTQIVM